MAVTNPMFSSSEDASTLQGWRIQMLADRPDTSRAAVIDPPITPNRIYGWYNGSSNMVELYMTNSLGNRYLNVSTYQDPS